MDNPFHTAAAMTHLADGAPLGARGSPERQPEQGGLHMGSHIHPRKPPGSKLVREAAGQLRPSQAVLLAYAGAVWLGLCEVASLRVPDEQVVSCSCCRWSAQTCCVVSSDMRQSGKQTRQVKPASGITAAFGRCIGCC